MSENPYIAPTSVDWVMPERLNFKEMPTKELKRLRNDSHSIRTLVVLIILGLGLLIVAMIGMIAGIGEGSTIGLAELAIVFVIAVFQSVVAFGLLNRPAWGRVLGFVAGALMLVGFPIGTLIGVLFLIALGRGSRLFGPERIPHKDLEAEWKYRRKNKVR
jgi:hypothetical protein